MFVMLLLCNKCCVVELVVYVWLCLSATYDSNTKPISCEHTLEDTAFMCESLQCVVGK